mmetsp:Transcript_21673/g.62710  ORF Transcript_21673/g.62710 Transcript_21673/m.62710 type:complete len:434 (-) Transcript_21673:79-1380(-)
MRRWRQISACALALCRCDALLAITDAPALIQASVQLQYDPDPRTGSTSMGIVFQQDGLADGDLFLGELKCSPVNMGMRLRIDKFPFEATLEIWPGRTWDALARLWCRPLTTCRASMKVGINPFLVEQEEHQQPTLQTLDQVAFEPLPGGAAMLKQKCNYNEFSITGSLAGGVYKGEMYGAFFFGARKDLKNFDSETPLHCKDQENAAKLLGGMVKCKQFVLERCKGTPPQDDEKVIWYLQTTQGDQASGMADGRLNGFGRKQSRNLKFNPRLERAFSADPLIRAEAIIVSPLIRSMETALTAFEEFNIPIFVDEHLMSQGAQYGWDRAQGSLLLKERNATKLLSRFEALTNKTAKMGPLQMIRALGTNQERMSKFKKRLLARPEQRLIVVGHRTLFEDAQRFANPMDGTPVDLQVLTAKGKWRTPPDPRCWHA